MMRRLLILLAWICLSESAWAQPAADQMGDAANPFVPFPKSAPAPKDNPTIPAKVALGKQLFFDPRLSGDNSISCASCHLPEKAFGDGLALGTGFAGVTLARNSQSCLNVGLFKSLFWDGRAASLEEQALGPIQSPVEMNQDLEKLEAELNLIQGYVKAFEQVFGTKPDREGIAKALAAYQRTLITGPSPLDRYRAGDKKALSEEARLGLELFQGEAGCSECHHGPLLSDQKFHRLGIAGKDQGRFVISKKPEDRYRFRTPSLRNIAETGPYMHNGSLRTLEDVVTFYYRGIPIKGPDGLAPDTTALSDRSFSEIPLLVAFLESLSGKPPEHTPPLLPGVLADQPETSISPVTVDEDGFHLHLVKSPYQAGTTEIRVLLPDQMKAQETYPVIYVLPVEVKRESRYGDGLREVKKHNLHNKHQAIFVAPTFSHLPWYADHPTDKEIRQESYLLKIVLPYIEGIYPANKNREGRLLLGFSKSGWGTWSLLLRNSEVFERAAAWDAPLMMKTIGKYGNRPIFGDQANFEKYRLIDLVKSSKLGNEARLIHTGYGNFRTHHEEVHEFLKDRNIPQIYRDDPKRKHDWHSGWVAEAVELLLNPATK